MSDIFINNFATLIKTRRVRSGMTQAELAVKTNVSLRSYQRIEAGESYPSINMIINAASALNFKFSDLFHYNYEHSKEQKILNRTLHLLDESTSVSQVGGWELDLVTDVLLWTEVTRVIHAVDNCYSPELNSAINFYQIGKSRDAIKKAVQECIDFGTPFSRELILINSKGEQLDVVVRGVAEFIDGKCQKIIGTIQDITDFKILEAELRNSVEELHETQLFAMMGGWKLDIAKNNLHWSRSLFEIFEIDSRKFQASYEAFLDIIHPEDRDMVNEAYTNSLKTSTDYEIEHRLLLGDGRIKWILEKCRHVYDDLGNPTMSIGYAQDITRFK